MDLLGWTLAVVGAALYLTAFARSVLANRMTILPYFGPPPAMPTGTLPLRLVGTALLVLGAIILAPSVGPPAILLVVAGPLIAAGGTALHNARVAGNRR